MRWALWLAAGVAGATMWPAANATATPAAPPASASAEPDEAAPHHPRLVLAVHGILGPHSVGEEECRQQGSAIVCDHTGRFLGTGGALSLRIRLYRFLYGHARLIASANAFGSNADTLHDGLLTPAAGLTLMSDLALLRVEFMAPFALGDSQYRAPGVSENAKETWGHAAGSLSLGARLRLHDRIRGELTAGVQVGPGVDRETPTEFDKRGPLITFQIGLGTSFDLVP